jgi:hypothetical protein
MKFFEPSPAGHATHVVNYSLLDEPQMAIALYLPLPRCFDELEFDARRRLSEMLWADPDQEYSEDTDTESLQADCTSEGAWDYDERVLFLN